LNYGGYRNLCPILTIATYAQFFYSTKPIEYLLRVGADPLQVNVDGELGKGTTIFHNLVRNYPHLKHFLPKDDEEMAQSLLRFWHKNRKGSKGRMSSMDDPAFKEQLLSLIDLQEKDSGLTALMYASTGGYNPADDSLKRVVEIGKANGQILDKNGENALFHWVRGSRNPELGMYLVQKAHCNPLQQSGISEADFQCFYPLGISSTKNTPRYRTALGVATGIVHEKELKSMEDAWLLSQQLKQ
jgi:hypothetical protein